MISLKDFFSFKNNKVFWLNLIAMPIVVIAIIFGVLHWLDTYTHHGESIIVPNVNGLPLKQAENELNKKNLRSVVIADVFDVGFLSNKDCFIPSAFVLPTTELCFVKFCSYDLVDR